MSSPPVIDGERPRRLPEENISRDEDVGRADEHLPRSSGEELRHVEALAHAARPSSLRSAEQALEQLVLGLVAGVRDLVEVAYAPAGL